MRMMAARSINEIEHLGPFLRRWLLPAASAAPIIRSLRSTTGNINLSGSVGSSRSALLARDEPDFFASVEPGVRALVSAFVAIGAITYTSCEGHDYGDNAPDEQHVGVLVRNDAEARQLEDMWRAAESVITPPLELGLMCHSVASEGRTIRAMDFYLTCGEGITTVDYFAGLPAASAAVTAAVLALRAK